MKFKIGDKVKSTAGVLTGEEGTIIEVEEDCRDSVPYEVQFPGMTHWKKECNLVLVELLTAYVPTKNTSHKNAIRRFDTGATRDTTQGKLDYVKALSPIVLRRYLQYLDKHRLQPDGSYRDFDNWKQGMPQDVYHSSNGRHFMDAWLLTEGYATEDNHGPVEIEDSLCAQLFNIMGRLHEILKDKVKRVEP